MAKELEMKSKAQNISKTSLKAEPNWFHLQVLGWFGPYGSAQPGKQSPHWGSKHVLFSLERSSEPRASQPCNHATTSFCFQKGFFFLSWSAGALLPDPLPHSS